VKGKEIELRMRTRMYEMLATRGNALGMHEEPGATQGHTNVETARRVTPPHQYGETTSQKDLGRVREWHDRAVIELTRMATRSEKELAEKERLATRVRGLASILAERVKEERARHAEVLAATIHHYEAELAVSRFLTGKLTSPYTYTEVLVPTEGKAHERTMNPEMAATIYQHEEELAIRPFMIDEPTSPHTCTQVAVQTERMAGAIALAEHAAEMAAMKQEYEAKLAALQQERTSKATLPHIYIEIAA